MARKPSNFITISDGKIVSFGGQVMERAAWPDYLYVKWEQDRVTFYREEDYEMRNQGIYKVGFVGGPKGKGGKARISAKPIIEEAGLVDGRYLPISVDEDKIVIGLTPVQEPDEYRIKQDEGAA
jgi:hypothetical protein